MKIAIILTHNKSPEENEAQIEIVKSLTETNYEEIDGTDESGKVIPGAFKQQYFTLKDLTLPHELLVYHIIPYQPENTSSPYKAILPANLGDINSWNVQYGKGDEDKTGDHPRFFNWGLKRATDNGADIVLHIEEIKYLVISELEIEIRKLLNPLDKTEFSEIRGGKLTTPKILEKIGKLDETKDINESMDIFKETITREVKDNG